MVGSINVESSQEAFTACASILGGLLQRFPDGETGERLMWTEWQHNRLLRHPAFEPASSLSYGRYNGLERVRLRSDVADEAIAFASPGYAAAALESFEVFSRLKTQGVVRDDARFLVALPTPLAMLEYVVVEDTLRVEPAYQQALLDDLAAVCEGIPHRDLAIQWDVCHEMVVLEGLVDAPFERPLAALGERISMLCDAVPRDVDVGLHFCYGSWHEEHFVEPSDMGHMVDLARHSLHDATRPVQFLHFPVPIDRTDDAYFAALDQLSLPEQAELFLGLVHTEDGVDGARRRAAAAARHFSDFGVAAECGLGRQDRQSVFHVLQTHADVAFAV
jgi:hypothetical protein